MGRGLVDEALILSIDDHLSIFQKVYFGNSLTNMAVTQDRGGLCRRLNYGP